MVGHLVEVRAGLATVDDGDIELAAALGRQDGRLPGKAFEQALNIVVSCCRAIEFDKKGVIGGNDPGYRVLGDVILERGGNRVHDSPPSIETGVQCGEADCGVTAVCDDDAGSRYHGHDVVLLAARSASTSGREAI